MFITTTIGSNKINSIMTNSLYGFITLKNMELISSKKKYLYSNNIVIARQSITIINVKDQK